VTFLMTDVAGSTRLWEEHPDVAGPCLTRHEAVIRTIVHNEGGIMLLDRGEGDSTFSVFSDALGAASAAARLQRALRAESWPPEAEVRVRAACYTGVAELHNGTYVGVAPCRCARLRDAVRPGHAVCAGSTAEQLAGLHSEIVVTDLGYFRLRDVAPAVHVFQLDHAELQTAFLPLRAQALSAGSVEPATHPLGAGAGADPGAT
jgi:class 3 adenylate cyclase